MTSSPELPDQNVTPVSEEWRQKLDASYVIVDLLNRFDRAAETTERRNAPQEPGVIGATEAAHFGKYLLDRGPDEQERELRRKFGSYLLAANRERPTDADIAAGQRLAAQFDSAAEGGEHHE